MTEGVSPDSEKLAALRGVAKRYLDRKRRRAKLMFFLAAFFEMVLFGSMLFFFDFSDRLYWFIFVGVCFVYSPLITMVYRNSFMLDRMYYRLLIELKYGGFESLDEGGQRSVPEDVPLSFESSANEEVRLTYDSKSRWATWLLVIAGFFEVTLFCTMLFLMDFTQQLDWFLLLGFLGVYTPMMISTWRNTVAIDRVFYGLVDELKYVDVGAVEE